MKKYVIVSPKGKKLLVVKAAKTKKNKPTVGFDPSRLR